MARSKADLDMIANEMIQCLKFRDVDGACDRAKILMDERVKVEITVKEKKLEGIEREIDHPKGSEEKKEKKPEVKREVVKLPKEEDSRSIPEQKKALVDLLKGLGWKKPEAIRVVNKMGRPYTVEAAFDYQEKNQS